jgi:predicted nucleic acid-binding Zn ribbon protein
MNARAGRLRHCVACGKLIVHRRMTALYCSGKCREIHNARKRRDARRDTKNAAQPMSPAASNAAETPYTPETEA